MRDPETDPTHYVQVKALENAYIWGEMEDDMKDEGIQAMEQFGLERTEVFMFPAGFTSILEMDRPLFLEKSLMLISGQV